MTDEKVGLTHPDLPDAPVFEVSVDAVPAWESRGWVAPKAKKRKPTKTEETS